MKIYGFVFFWTGPDKLWNWFDIACLMLMGVELSMAVIFTQGDLGGLGILKVFRLLRLMRLIRTLRFKIFLELKLMIQGVMSGLRTLLWAIILLLLTVWILGMAMRTVMGDQEPEFASVPSAMFTFFRCFTDGCVAYDGTPLVERLRRDYRELEGLIILLDIFLMMLVTVGIFNLIMAVFIDNVTGSQFLRKQKEIQDTSAQYELLFKKFILRFLKLPFDEETMPSALVKDEHLKMKMMSAEISEILLDSMMVTRDEFHSWMLDEEFLQCLKNADIDISHRHELFDTLDADAGGSLSPQELVTGLMLLRGPVTKADVIGISVKVRYMTEMMEATIRQSCGE